MKLNFYATTVALSAVAAAILSVEVPAQDAAAGSPQRMVAAAHGALPFQDLQEIFAIERATGQ